ncbi:hypothetical protein SEA_CRUNCHYBOI_22 [Microbacterium phage CrunchyBoi]|nr:hypothetical protein SEA_PINEAPPLEPLUTO_22 [Microbacterium phage PineapplePluto]QQO39365.1 hypothetical protein SEA_CRUNCHYBOI_22 [Microbacterium phage CrunchyBoi]
MSEALNECTDTVVDNCFVQFRDTVTVHYKGEDFWYTVPEGANAIYAIGEDCTDTYVACNTTGVVWEFEPVIQQGTLPATGVDPTGLIIGIVLGVVLAAAGAWLLSAGGKRRSTEKED